MPITSPTVTAPTNSSQSDKPPSKFLHFVNFTSKSERNILITNKHGYRINSYF